MIVWSNSSSVLVCVPAEFDSASGSRFPSFVDRRAYGGRPRRVQLASAPAGDGAWPRRLSSSDRVDHRIGSGVDDVIRPTVPPSRPGLESATLPSAWCSTPWIGMNPIVPIGFRFVDSGVPLDPGDIVASRAQNDASIADGVSIRKANRFRRARRSGSRERRISRPAVYARDSRTGAWRKT